MFELVIRPPKIQTCTMQSWFFTLHFGRALHQWRRWGESGAVGGNAACIPPFAAYQVLLDL